MALSQVGLLIGIWIMADIDPQNAPLAIAALAVMVAFFSASQDVVADAYRTDVLPPGERASGTSTWIMGYRIAMLVSGAGALVLSDYMPWSRVYMLMAISHGRGHRGHLARARARGGPAPAHHRRRRGQTLR
jgi:PAT family beta-lactamase induction signal transducer AmpG